jgi:hypothetical protein
VVLEVRSAGQTQSWEFLSDERAAGAYGELLRLELRGSCATAYAAGRITAGAPQWSQLGAERCIAVPFATQALEVTDGDVLFAGTRREFVQGGAWIEAQVDLAAPRSGDYDIVDPADPAAAPLFAARSPAALETYDRGPGYVPHACRSDEQADTGLCYPVCAPGYESRGPYCYGPCAAGYATDPLTCRRDGHLYAKPSYGRGVGAVPTACAISHELDSGLCYRKCATGFHGVGPYCWADCPPLFADDGATCRRDATIFGADTSACPGYDICGLTFARGCSKCPGGYTNDGCTCRRDAVVIAKTSYHRGGGTAPTDCASGQQYDSGLCYPVCASGYSGTGPTCWGRCAPGYVDDGATCRRDPVIYNRPVQDRGAGRTPDCDVGSERNAGLCYARCASAFLPHPSQVTSCQATCAAGRVDDASRTCTAL